MADRNKVDIKENDVLRYDRQQLNRTETPTN